MKPVFFCLSVLNRNIVYSYFYHLYICKTTIRVFLLFSFFKNYMMRQLYYPYSFIIAVNWYLPAMV